MPAKKDRKGGILTRPPFNTILKYAAIAEILFVTLPATLAYYVVSPNSRPHPKWPLLRSIFISQFKHFRARTRRLGFRTGAIDKTVMPKMSAKADATALWIPPINPHTELEGDLKVLFEAGSCTVLERNLVYWYGQHHKTKGGRKAQKGEKVILYSHGGGYFEQSALPTNPTTNCLRLLLSASAKSANKSAPKRALSVEYRLSDDTSFPGILADALAAWKYLIELGFEPRNILIAGDSAGANLTLALTRYLIQNRPFYSGWKQGDQVADGIVLFSPWVDITLSYLKAGDSPTDYLNPTQFRVVTDALLDGIPKDAASNLLLSSLCKDRETTESDFDGFPRAIIFGGSLELLIEEIRILSQQLNIAAKVGRCKPAAYIEEPLAAHDWCALPFGFADEQKRTLEHLTHWI